MVHNDLIHEKIHETSRDDRLLEGVSRLKGILESLGVKYVVIGSCGIHTYFEWFQRLPDDLDIVVGSQDTERILAYARASDMPVNAQLGRYQMMLARLPVHILSDYLNIVDLQSDQIFARVDLRLDKVDLYLRNVVLLSSPERIQIPVPSLEILFCLNLLAPLNTNTVLDSMRILDQGRLGRVRLCRFMSDNPDIKPIIIERLLQLRSICTRNKIPVENEIERVMSFLED